MSLDLRSILPDLLPRAIAWAETQSQHVAKLGQTLDTTGLAIARSVGVKRPDRVRVNLVDQLPLPVDPLLLQAALETGLLGPSMVGLLLSHECRHVYQYELLGSITEFLAVYLEQIVTTGYRDAPLEVDARSYERDVAQRVAASHLINTGAR